MVDITIQPLSDDLPFGARVGGVDHDNVADEGVRARLNALFEERGLIVFEGMVPTLEMQIAVSKVFGPLKEHSYKGITTVEGATPGVMVLDHRPGELGVLEIDGEELAGWTPWHFDAGYNRELNRAGVLRALEIPAEGGMTGFADGIQLYQAISPALRDRIEGKEILYHPKLMAINIRYGRPRRLLLHSLAEDVNAMFAANAHAERAIHPAVWQRRTGEKVLHVMSWQADGIFGHEDDEGDALLDAVLKEVHARVVPYYHAWKPTDMVIWDNWRMLHRGVGYDPKYGRLVHRTTIEGDYGLGRFEHEGAEGRAAEAMA
jgi:taurine dioxygenase